MYWTFNCSWDNVMKWNVFFFCVLHIFQNFPCTLGEKSKSVSFLRVYVCVKAKLSLVSFFLFFAPSPDGFCFFTFSDQTSGNWEKMIAIHFILTGKWCLLAKREWHSVWDLLEQVLPKKSSSLATLTYHAGHKWGQERILTWWLWWKLCLSCGTRSRYLVICSQNSLDLARWCCDVEVNITCRT